MNQLCELDQAVMEAPAGTFSAAPQLPGILSQTSCATWCSATPSTRGEASRGTSFQGGRDYNKSAIYTGCENCLRKQGPCSTLSAPRLGWRSR
jgi:hypothetical protein